MKISDIIKKDGYYVSDDLIDNDDLSKLKDFILEKTKIYPEKNFRLYEDSFKNSIISEKKFEDKLSNIISQVLAENNINNNKPSYKVLRVVAGEQQKKQAYLYHFDAHLITILIPIVIPDNKSGKNGDLVLFPNIRKLHRNLILNIVQKVFFQNIIVRNLLNIRFVRNMLKYKILKIQPGKLYMFFGFNSLHGNLEIENSSTRATLLVHCYDIFDDSALIKRNRNQSINKEIKNIKV